MELTQMRYFMLVAENGSTAKACLLYTSPSPRDS